MEIRAKDALCDALTRRGHRMTRQREVVFECLLGTRDHPTADQVFARVRNQLPSISLATVYNCLESLVECQLIRQINFSKQPSRYCPIHDSEEHYAHLYDTDSGSVEDVDLPDNVIDAIRRALPGDYEIHRLEINLTGRRNPNSKV